MPIYDRAKRRQGIRKTRERGAWIYIPAEELRDAGYDPQGPPPFYRLWGKPKKAGLGTVMVQLYTDS